MRYCLSARQPKEYLKKAQEIMLQWNDKDNLYDFIEAYPHTYFTLYCPQSIEKDWSELAQFVSILQERFQLCLESEIDIPKAKRIGAKYFLNSLVRDFYSLNRYISLGVCAARITAPLTHNTKALETFKNKIELRIFPNQPGIKATKSFDGFVGGWVRPEDMTAASTTYNVVEFLLVDDIKREQALFRIYAEKYVWPGELYLLIDGINDRKIMNSLLPPDFYDRRSRCKQKCQEGSLCHYCETISSMATEEFVHKLKETVKGE